MTNNLIKNEKRSEQTSLQRGYANTNKHMKEMLNITSHHRMQVKNHSEMRLHTYKNGYSPNKKQSLTNVCNDK
jgi:hypothetical protein